jgi:hypothetical protein
MAQLISSHFNIEPQNWGSISKVRQILPATNYCSTIFNGSFVTRLFLPGDEYQNVPLSIFVSPSVNL